VCAITRVGSRGLVQLVVEKEVLWRGIM